jgi:flagellar hook assembly protein FlgD
MKLLVTQLQNQDPLNPMDNAAMTSQLAQLSTVTGINKVNSTLESLRTDLASPVATAINLIGKGVLVAGKGIDLSSDRRRWQDHQQQRVRHRPGLGGQASRSRTAPARPCAP